MPRNGRRTRPREISSLITHRAVDAAGHPLGDIDRDCDTDLVDYQSFLSGFTGPLTLREELRSEG